MTLDDAIKLYKTLAKDIEQYPLVGDSSYEYRQLIKWLEELKAIKNGAVFYSRQPIEEIYLDGYYKGAEDFYEGYFEFGCPQDKAEQEDCHSDEEFCCFKCYKRQFDKNRRKYDIR